VSDVGHCVPFNRTSAPFAPIFGLRAEQRERTIPFVGGQHFGLVMTNVRSLSGLPCTGA